MTHPQHECGVAAIYHLPNAAPSPMLGDLPISEVSRLLPRMLQDIQNRGQLAAGMTSYQVGRAEILKTHKDVGTVSEVFRLSHRDDCEQIMQQLSGPAAIGHVRYATCGKDDRTYAQPFERLHIHKRKWFSFCFNGQLANYKVLRDRLLANGDHHLARETDTEIILHEIGRLLSELSGARPDWIKLIGEATKDFDGAYSLALLSAHGELLLARDPLGIKPMCYAIRGPLLAAASESVALLNLRFEPEEILSLEPGYAVFASPETGFNVERFAPSPRRAHCFFEWIYFANVASTLDERSVYLSRTRLGEELALQELADGTISLDPSETIIVPVPDTSKAAADAMAYKLGIPSREGLIRNRYAGRTFIEGGRARKMKAAAKYTPLREVLEGKRVILVEDSIVRSTTMNVLLDRIRSVGGAKEIHVRVACPPIIAPCFYGIDMSSVDQLFAPKFMEEGLLTLDSQRRMAETLGANSLRYLPIEAIARAINLPRDRLCQACITANYPTPHGQRLYQLDLEKANCHADPTDVAEHRPFEYLSTANS